MTNKELQEHLKKYPDELRVELMLRDETGKVVSFDHPCLDVSAFRLAMPAPLDRPTRVVIAGRVRPMKEDL